MTPTVAVHHLTRSAAAPLLISHATGFHGRCYRALAEALGGRFDAWAIDQRGHGATPLPEGWTVDWHDYAADTITVAAALADLRGRPVVGFGHSMGGSLLLLAAGDRPELFERLILFEPIALPASNDRGPMPLAEAARRRRRSFESLDAAHANFAAKPPMSLMRDDVLWDYVRHGFRPSGDGGVELACSPNHEAATFEAAMTAGVWEALPGVDVATLVIAGVITSPGGSPAERAPHIATRLRRAGLLTIDGLTHFGPFSHPESVAATLIEQVDS